MNQIKEVQDAINTAYERYVAADKTRDAAFARMLSFTTSSDALLADVSNGIGSRKHLYRMLWRYAEQGWSIWLHGVDGKKRQFDPVQIVARQLIVSFDNLSHIEVQLVPTEEK